MLREIALILHLVGVVLWIGSSIVVAAIAAHVRAKSDDGKDVLSVVYDGYRKVGGLGIGLAWLGGLTLFIHSLDIYRHAGWLHAKITVGLVASAVHGALIARIKPRGAKPATARTFAVMSLVLIVCALTAISLVVIRPQ